MATLGVNIDHVATVRQARRGIEPDPVWAAVEAELGGADQITVHLREDRRHIQERDVELLIKTVQTRVNLELAVASDVLRFALKVKPYSACLVPERREEVTTEGGLDAAGSLQRVKSTVAKLNDAGIVVSLFIDPVEKQIEAAAKSGAAFIELHTGTYANAKSEKEFNDALLQLQNGARQAIAAGLRINAGHGLNYRNVAPIARIPNMEELNIGHSIVSRAIFVGLRGAVHQMKILIDQCT